jgi:hypothetical protein
MIRSKLLIIILFISAFLFSGCRRSGQIASSPTLDTPSIAYQGPAPEIENQATSTPIVVETLPGPAAATAELQPNLPPPQPHVTAPKPTKPIIEPRREVKTPVPVETRPAVQAPPILLSPQLSSNDKTALAKKISEQLESARSLLKSVNESQLSEDRKPYFSAVQDFIKKSEDAVRRGEYYQGLVLAQKAKTLAASIASGP